VGELGETEANVIVLDKRITVTKKIPREEGRDLPVQMIHCSI
jgi:hypothetical protein